MRWKWNMCIYSWRLAVQQCAIRRHFCGIQCKQEKPRENRMDCARCRSWYTMCKPFNATYKGKCVTPWRDYFSSALCARTFRCDHQLYWIECERDDARREEKVCATHISDVGPKSRWKAEISQSGTYWIVWILCEYLKNYWIYLWMTSGNICPPSQILYIFHISVPLRTLSVSSVKIPLLILRNIRISYSSRVVEYWIAFSRMQKPHMMVMCGCVCAWCLRSVKTHVNTTVSYVICGVSCDRICSAEMGDHTFRFRGLFE